MHRRNKPRPGWPLLPLLLFLLLRMLLPLGWALRGRQLRRPRPRPLLAVALWWWASSTPQLLRAGRDLRVVSAATHYEYHIGRRQAALGQRRGHVCWPCLEIMVRACS